MSEAKIHLELEVPQMELLVTGLQALGQQYSMMAVDLGNQAAPQFMKIVENQRAATE